MIKINQVKKDILYHDLLNDSNIDIIEFIVMQVLELSYLEVHGKCKVSNSRLSRIDVNDRMKYSDLVISYMEYDIIIELNNNFNGNLKRNILYALTRLVKVYGKYESNKNNNNIKLDEESALEKLKELRKKQRKYKNNYYKDKFKVILINLNWYRKGNDYIEYQRQEIIHAFDNPNKGIFLKVVNINLDKYANMSYNEVKENEKFYKLLTIDKYDELIKFVDGNKLLDRYVNDLIKYSKDEESDDSMDIGIEMHFRDEEIYDLGETEGIKKGIEKNKKEMIINMFKDGMKLDLIAKYSNLTIKKVKEIITKYKNNS